MWSASIRVVDDDGNPVSDRAVNIQFSLFTGSDTQYTDSDGWAVFEYSSIARDKLWVDDIYIDSVHVAEDFYLENGETMSFTRP